MRRSSITCLAALVALVLGAGAASAGRVRAVRALQLEALGFGRSAAASGGRVVIGANDGPLDGFVCGDAGIFDVASGELVRSLYEVVWAPSEPCAGAGFGVAVAAGGGRVAVSAPATRTVLLFSLDGDLERAVRHPDAGVPGADASTHGFGTSVALDEGTLLVGGAADGVYAFDPASGTLRWSRDAFDGFRVSVAVAGGRAFVGREGAVVAFDAVSGAELWEATAPPPFDPFPLAFGASLAADEEAVLVGGWRNVHGRAVALLLDAASGAIRRRYRGPRPHRYDPGGEIFGTSVALGSDLVVVGDPRSRNEWGGAYVYSRRRGTRIATFRPEPFHWQHAGTAVAVADGRIVAGSPETSDAHVFSVGGRRGRGDRRGRSSRASLAAVKPEPRAETGPGGADPPRLR